MATAVTAAADDEEEFEEFESEHWPVTEKEDATLWDAEVRRRPQRGSLCARTWRARASTRARATARWRGGLSPLLRLRLPPLPPVPSPISLGGGADRRAGGLAAQWDNDEVDEEFAKKFQAEMEKMEAEKAEQAEGAGSKSPPLSGSIE
jgi:hypothetical protein